MKNKSTIVLMVITGIFVLITIGILIGRSTGNADVIISAEKDATVTQNTGSAYVTDGKLNINTADIAALCELPSIGETTAQRIVAYREEHGPFKDITELMNVDGIGEKTLDNISKLITVGG